MALQKELLPYVRACFTGIWVCSFEPAEALRSIAALCRDEHWNLATWDIVSGLRIAGHVAPDEASGTDPPAAIRALEALGNSGTSSLMVLVTFHRFLQSAEVVQAVLKQLERGKQQRTFLIIVAPVVQLPPELERQFVVIEHPLPSREELLEIARGVATEPEDLPDGAELDRVIDAAAGLTRQEAENAFALALVRHGHLEPSTLWKLKAETLAKGGMLLLHRGSETFDDQGGLDALKAFCRRALRPRLAGASSCAPCGILLLGVPGTGKSAVAKALGNEIGRPTLVLDVGSLMGSLVGQSEERTRQALATIDAMAPCILFIDEIDKALSGVAGSGATDSGVSARMFGTLLSWLNDHTSDVFMVCSANDVSRLPPEFTRAERFDGVFFLDLPSRAAKDAIWRMYRDHFGIDAKESQPADDQWTGAEIKACCRLAALLDLPLSEAAKQVVPVAITASDSVERLRQWASGRCLSADAAGIYQFRPTGSSKRRAINIDPSAN
ncbi:MAG: AAA family ATPase [Pirellulales bacterium]